MKCTRCDTKLKSIYYRVGAGGKEWIKIDWIGYCKKCETVRKEQK